MRTASAPGPWIGLLLVLTGLLLSGCASDIVFRSSFNQNPVGQPPAATQAVGTVTVGGTAGRVVVVEAPSNQTPPQPSGHWVQISRIRGPQNAVNGMTGHLQPVRGDGTYTFVAVMYIPRGSGLATVELATHSQASPPNFGFFHLDFLENNRVRINDNNAITFGTFPRGQTFTLIVTLRITAASAIGDFQLLGGAGGASGELKNVSLVTPVFPLSLARQFGAVRFSMGFDWGGSFDVTEIIVTYKNP